jgi:hypothetical protein
MGTRDLWVIVEGRDHDRPHYDKLLKKLPATGHLKVQIRLAEQIRVGATVAGGKQHVLAVHDHLAPQGKLTQANRDRVVRMVFMLDRDRDDYSAAMSTSPHVMYTVGTDVEADILLNSEIWAATRSAYGIDTSLTKRIKRRAADPARSLQTLWSEWLRLGLTALDCGAPGCAPWSQHSQVNSDVFGSVDSAKLHAAESAIIAAAPSRYAAADRRATRWVAQRGELLLKGRWIAKFLQYLVATHLSGEVVRSVHPHVVVDTALARLKYSGDWIRDYDARFRLLLAIT